MEAKLLLYAGKEHEDVAVFLMIRWDWAYMGSARSEVTWRGFYLKF